MFILQLIGFFTLAWGSEHEITDATQYKTKLNVSPKRIVCLAPSLAEWVATLVPDYINRIVGVSEYTDFPESLKKIASIGPFNRINIEKVIELKPDLVLATQDGNAEEQIKRLRKLGLPVIVTSTAHFSEWMQSFQWVADALDASELGKKLNQDFSKKFSELKNSIQQKTKNSHKRVFLQISDLPIVTASKRSLLGTLIYELGFQNIYHEMNSAYPRPSLEDILIKNPEVIIIIGMSADPRPAQDMAEKWKKLQVHGQLKGTLIKIISGDYLARPTPRLLIGIEELKKALDE